MKMMSENEVREIIRDYLNLEVKKEELMSKFDLQECECGQVEFVEDMVNRKHDLNNTEDKQCPDCKENE